MRIHEITCDHVQYVNHRIAQCEASLLPCLLIFPPWSVLTYIVRNFKAIHIPCFIQRLSNISISPDHRSKSPTSIELPQLSLEQRLINTLKRHALHDVELKPIESYRHHYHEAAYRWSGLIGKSTPRPSSSRHLMIIYRSPSASVPMSSTAAMAGLTSRTGRSCS